MEISILDILRIMRKNVVLIVSFFVVFTVATYCFTSFLVDKKYQASVKFCVDTSAKGTGTSADEVNALSYAQRLVNTYIEVLNTNNFYTQVSEELNNEYTPSEIQSMVTFSVLNETEVFQADIVTLSPTDSKKIADAIEVVAPPVIENYNEEAVLKIVDSAQVPKAPISPNVTVNTLVGALIGLFIAIVISIVRNTLDVTIKSEEDLETKLELPILAYIPDTTTKL